MKIYKKAPLTYQKQLNLLERRGLIIDNKIIDNKIETEKFLSQVNYYRFSAYCIPFEVTRHSFKNNVTFEQVKQLYEFDRQLRFLINEALEVIEISVRTTLAYHLAHKCGPFMHENSANFYRKDEFPGWIENVHKEAKRSKEVFIEHYKTRYEDFPKLPIWMAVEVMSLGSLSKLYSYLMREDQIEISKKFKIHSSLMASWLHTFTYVRNICAHHGRLWNRELAIAMVVSKSKEWENINEKRIAAVIFAINHFLAKIDEKKHKEWIDRIDEILSEPVDLEDFYFSMGSQHGFDLKGNE